MSDYKVPIEMPAFIEGRPVLAFIPDILPRGVWQKPSGVAVVDLEREFVSCLVYRDPDGSWHRECGSYFRHSLRTTGELYTDARAHMLTEAIHHMLGRIVIPIRD